MTLTASVATVGKPWAESPYFENAERLTHIFWDERSLFKRQFDKLDLSSAVELACGHGRHAEKSAPLSGTLTLIDIFPQHIAASHKRLAGRENVFFVVGNGYDFRPLGDASVTAIYCFDAMVHFSPDLVSSYLKDTARVLKAGGKALFHHSNYDAPPNRSYGQNPHARNHMTKDLFDSLCETHGLEILESSIIGWGGIPELDCLSLVTIRK